MNDLYAKVMSFKRRFPITIGWRTKAHCQVVVDHLFDDEQVLYAFTAQKSNATFNWLTTCVVALTDKRLVIGQKRVAFGYFFYSITPDLFNDLDLKMGLLWGKVTIDTVKEVVYLSNISKGALSEIEQNISEYMMEEKKKYNIKEQI